MVSLNSQPFLSLNQQQTSKIEKKRILLIFLSTNNGIVAGDGRIL
jgi:hypothetical protein